MATKEQTANFFGGGLPADQGSDKPKLLPTRKRDGAPKDNKYLVEFAEDSVEIRHSGESSKNPGHPYIAFRLEVVEPERFAGRGVYGMFYYPVDADEDATEEEIERVAEFQTRYRGAIDTILGEGTMENLEGADLEESLENLCAMLEGVQTVAKVRFRKGQDGFEDKVEPSFYYALDTWEGEED